MSIIRRNPRVDGNQREIVAALRKAGASVQSLGQVGRGCPDLLVGYQGVNYLLEIKELKGKVSESQRQWAGAWLGGYVYLCRSVDDALLIIQARGRNLPVVERSQAGLGVLGRAKNRLKF